MTTHEKNEIITLWRSNKNICYLMLLKQSYGGGKADATMLWKCLRRGLTIEQAFEYLETGKFPLPQYIQVKKTKNGYAVKLYATLLPNPDGESTFYAGSKIEAWKFARAFYKKRVLDRDVEYSIAVKKTFK